MAALISIRGLKKAFGRFMVLHGIDLDIAEGEVVCVIGPSGSGKSTLIRCINHLEGFEKESSVTVDGVRVEQGAPPSPKCGRRSAWCFSLSICSRI